ncbi:hypothetical protein C0J26_20595 [Pseudomonas baetica]|nr:hypothetical protein C0J26_20595 [Pseudomonas baetica]
MQNQCGSEPARESGESVTESVTDIAHSRAGSLPQGYVLGLRSIVCCWIKIREHHFGKTELAEIADA